MHLTLIKNTDTAKKTLYKLARIIYAQTNVSSLAAIEAMASMVSNLCASSKRDLFDIIQDESIFDSLNINSSRNSLLLVNSQCHDFQMCLRVVTRMINGALPDSCGGATKFHNIDSLPDWAVARGYITEIDELLFYL